MEAARAFLLVLGAIFAVSGLVVASAVEPILGMGVLIVGAFLLILPFLAFHADE